MGTHYPGTDDEIRALDAYVKLARAHAAVDATINHDLIEAGLTVSQFGVLEAIWHLGPLPQGALARKILRSAANLTTVLDNLARRDLIERSRDPADRRVVIVRLTDAGRDLIGPYLPRHVRPVMHALSALTPGQ
ncbi:MAG: MarR family transcriptional regulator, partial [Trueperaceae bacterium]